MVQRCEQFAGTRIVQTALDADGTLAHGRKRQLWRQGHANARLQPQTLEAGNGEDNGIVIAVIQLAQTRADVTAQRANDQVRTALCQLTLTA